MGVELRLHPVNLPTLLTDLLAVAVEVLGDLAPERRYVAHGRPAEDCEQLTVHLAAEPFLSFNPALCLVVPRATFVVGGWWCWPGPDSASSDGAPSAEVLGDAALMLATVGQRLGQGLADKWAECTLFPSVPALSCGNVSLEPGLEPAAPLGGFAGWRFILSVQE